MSYYEVLGLNKEPFSTSPDPEFFYKSTAHDTALKRIEIGIRLRRGLSVVMGDVGTGKTTLSRTLLNAFKDEDKFIFHLILDPTYNSEFQFLTHLVRLFGVNPRFKSSLDYKEAIEKYLFTKGVDEDKTVILLIDEGQKLTPGFLEVLRTLLNYETNEYKLLQLVILSQLEMMPKITKIRNFVDRIALKYIINPLDEIETREMIYYRLRRGGLTEPRRIFSEGAMKAIYNLTQGYPRRIAITCHNALETIVMQGKDTVDVDVVQELARAGAI